MGLVQVAHNSYTNNSTATSLGIDSNDVYMVVLNDLYMNTNEARPRLRFTKSSDNSADTDSNYRYANFDRYSNQVSNVSNAGASYWNGFSTGTTKLLGLRGIYYLYNFNNASKYSYVEYNEIAYNSAGENALRKGGLCFTANTQHNGFQWHSSNNNIANAQVTLYRIT